jgi:Phosphoglycerate dehydrogenase and related dehydrogenases
MIMKVLVSDSLAEDGVKRLQSGADVDVITNLSPEELIQKIPDYDALVIRSGTKVTADVINAAKRLKVIGRAGVGIDNVDVEAATKKGIIVLNTPGGNTISAAEHTIAMMLALARNIPQANSALHQGEWNRKKYTGVEFFNKTLGVVGLGRVGAEVATRMKSFGMRILAYDPFVTEEKAQQMGLTLANLETVLREGDFITVHTPLTNETRNLIDDDEFKIMKDGVRIVNCARGGYHQRGRSCQSCGRRKGCRSGGRCLHQGTSHRKPPARAGEDHNHSPFGSFYRRGPGQCRLSSGRPDPGHS